MSFKPVILMPFIEPSMAVVEEMRLSMASSHSDWRETTNPNTMIDPTSETTNWTVSELKLYIYPASRNVPLTQ